MITGKYERQLDRSNGSKNVRDLALHIVPKSESIDPRSDDGSEEKW